MSKPKNMTPEQELEWKAKQKLYHKKWQLNNIEKTRSYARNWCKANPEKHREGVRRWKENNPEKVKLEKAKWNKENPLSLPAMQAKGIKARSALKPSYIANKLGISVKLLEQNPSILEAKRTQITTTRTLKKINENIAEN